MKDICLLIKYDAIKSRFHEEVEEYLSLFVGVKFDMRIKKALEKEIKLLSIRYGFEKDDFIIDVEDLGHGLEIILKLRDRRELQWMN